MLREEDEPQHVHASIWISIRSSEKPLLDERKNIDDAVDKEMVIVHVI